MNKQQKAVQKAALTAEEAELKALKAIYQQASSEVAEKIAIHQGTINTLLCNYDKLSEKEKSILQSKIYQKQFQESIQKQLDGFLEDLDSKQFESIYAYLDECYKNGYIGTMYDLAGQGIPIVTPIDQQDVAKAIHIDSQISTNLYTKLGEDVDLLKAKIKASISVGIATASPYSQMAKKIASDSNVGFNRAMRIARTEGHRVQISAAMDAQHNAKSKGADVLKQWSSALDARTRPTHRILDNQIRELDDYFEVNGKKTLAPGHFGIAGEDINCRCGILQKARWALDDDELEKMQKRAEYFGLDKSYQFEDFKKKYLEIPSDNTSNVSLRNYGKHRNHLGANDKDDYFVKNHKPYEIINKIDINDINAVESQLKRFEKEAVYERIETACVIAKDGTVYKCYGVIDSVYPDYDLGDKLIGAIVSHNHPIDVTEYSFSNDDFALFQKYKLPRLIGFDEKYKYEFNRNSKTIDRHKSIFELTADDYAHESSISRAEEANISYHRFENE